MGKLVKIVSNLNYAQMLLDGCLFMRPAIYYHDLEMGQGDRREGRLLDNTAIYQNTELPIYCMCAIEENEIIDNRADISAKCISDFSANDGYAVVLDWREFEKWLPNINRDGYCMKFGRVSYKRRDLENFLDIFNDRTMENLFIKYPYFAYQKEYRIVVGKPVFSFSNENRSNHVIYHFPNDLRDIGYIVGIRKHLQEDGTLRLPILKNTNRYED